MNLAILGWSPIHQKSYTACAQTLADPKITVPGRIAAVLPGLFRVWTEEGEITATLPGRLRGGLHEECPQPAVGDWAALEAGGSGGSAVIRRILPRTSRISRNSAGQETREQVLAANVDIAFIVGSLNGELNFNRMERFLVAAFDGGTMPVMLLNKSDLLPESRVRASSLESRMPGVPVRVISALSGEGMEEVGGYLETGRTAVFLGSSGVGKSTIINRLLGREAVNTAGISDYKDRGRHTTTSREMHLLGSGGIVIDTPGLRELQIWEGGNGVAQTFPDIEELAGRCRFDDCRHQGEPGCAVKEAVEEGAVSQERFRSYQKILREARFHQRRQSVRLRMEETRRWKSITKAMRHCDKARRQAGD